MRKKSGMMALVLALLLAGALPALGFAAADMNAALDYLKTQQNADGGFGSGFSPDSAIGSTADAVLAIVSAGGDLATFDQGGSTPLTYLAANTPTTGGDLAKLIMALVAAGQNPRDFGGVDSVAALEGMVGVDGMIGTENDTFVAHTLAVLALSSVQRPIPAASVDIIKAAQQENGSWAWDGTAATAGDTNTTAFAVQALVAAGEAADSEAVTKALAYYKSIQNDDGGLPYQNPSDYGTDTDANSTAVVIQAIIAAGQDPAGADWTAASGTPVAALEALQNESGAFAWQAAMPDDNLLATVQALPALAGKAFPIASMEVDELEATPLTAPETMPETGGALANLAVLMLAGGTALAGGGLALRWRRTGTGQ